MKSRKQKSCPPKNYSWNGFLTSRRRGLFVSVDSVRVGFPLFFNNFSTFLERAEIYLEYLHMPPNITEKGIEKRFLRSSFRLL